jgi:hypothetical protein
MKQVSRREFLGAAIGTGLVGTASLSGIPFLPKEVSSYLEMASNNPNTPTTNQTKNEPSLGYDIIPPYFHWRFGNEYRGNLHTSKSSEFEVWLTPEIERKEYNFRTAVINKCMDIDKKRDGKPIALCYGGGESSEVIALALKEIGIPFDLYFADTWRLNIRSRITHAEPFAKKIGVPLRVIGIDKDTFELEELKKNTITYGADNPNFSIMTNLFNAIPDTHFIVTGSGHLERSGAFYAEIGKANPIPEGAESYYRPFLTRHINFYQWAQKNNRVGEFYFFQSSQELIASVIQDPIVHRNYPFYSHNQLIYSSFPEITPRAKSTNWEGDLGQDYAKFFRKCIQNTCHYANNFSYYKKNIGCAVNLAAIYKA